MIFIAQSWVRHRSKKFVYFDWVYRLIVKVKNWMEKGIFCDWIQFLAFVYLKSELGFVFHWKAHWFIVSELSLRSLAEILISWTTENKDALSANNLLSLLKSLDTLTDTRMDINPRKTLTIQSYSLRRKSSKMLRISPLAPYWRNLKSSPLCQTLS